MVDYNDIRSLTPHWDFNEFVMMLPNKGNLLEIGSFVGKSTVCWAKTFQEHGKIWNIHTVDGFTGLIHPSLWPPQPNMNMTEEEMESFIAYMEPYVMTGEEQLNEFLQNIEGWDNITWEQKWIDETYVPPVPPTALFYDGDHSYQGMKHVFDTLGDTRYIFIDDCTPTWPASEKILKELGREYEINENGVGIVNESFTHLRNVYGIEVV